MTLDDLRHTTCVPNAPALPADQAAALARLLTEWELADGAVARTFRFDDYHRTIAFVNAVAWVSHRTDHHPDLEVGYNRCRVRYTTHSAGGLTLNDLACAAKVDALLA